MRLHLWYDSLEVWGGCEADWATRSPPGHCAAVDKSDRYSAVGRRRRSESILSLRHTNRHLQSLRQPADRLTAWLVGQNRRFARWYTAPFCRGGCGSALRLMSAGAGASIRTRCSLLLRSSFSSSLTAWVGMSTATPPPASSSKASTSSSATPAHPARRHGRSRWTIGSVRRQPAQNRHPRGELPNFGICQQGNRLWLHGGDARRGSLRTGLRHHRKRGGLPRVSARAWCAAATHAGSLCGSPSRWPQGLSRRRRPVLIPGGTWSPAPSRDSRTSRSIPPNSWSPVAASCFCAPTDYMQQSATRTSSGF